MADDFTETVEILVHGKPVEPNPDLPVIDISATELGSQPASSRRLNRWVLVGGGLATVAAVGGAMALRRRAKSKADATLGGGADVGGADVDDADADAENPAEPDVAPPKVPGKGWWTRVPSLPTEDDVPGFDLANNWGKTPKNLRPLFALMEEVSQIRGSARIFALIAYREAGFKVAAHNDSAAETGSSRLAYKNAKDRNRPLTYGEASGEFGSGGLFGALAPYFLWTGVQEMKGNAPLLGAPPEVMFVPRIAAFGAVVYLQRLLTYYTIDDHADIKVGWASPSLLKKGRGGSTYKTVRTRFYSDASELGLDLEDTTTIPKTLSAKSWPGAATAFTALTTIPVQDTAEG